MDKLENMSTVEKLDDNESKIHEPLKDNDICINDTQDPENNESDIIEGSQNMQKNVDDFIIADTQDLDKIGDYVPQNEEETGNSITDCIEETQNTDVLGTNCIAETQDTYFEQLDESISSKAADVSGNVNESQDFQLIDSQEMEDTIPDVMNNDSTGSKELEKSELNSETNIPLTKEKDDVANSDTKNQEDATADESMEDVVSTGKEELLGKVEEKEEEEEEEEDVIQGTPPPTHSPPTKQQIIPDHRTPSVKRKVENFDEPPKKLIKLCTEDLLNSDKKDKVDADSCVEFNKPDDTSHVNSIIKETQDAEENDENLIEMDENKDNEKSQLNTNEIDDVDMFADLKDGSSGDNDVTDEIKGKTDDETNEEKSKQLETVDNEDTTISTQEKGPEKTVHDESNDQTNNIESISHHETDEKIQEEAEETTEDNEKTMMQNDVDMPEKSSNAQKSRMSIEVIFDKSLSQEQKTKPVEIVEIDEEGEKIVLDSSQEDAPGKVNPEKSALNTTEYVTCHDTKSSSDVSYKSAKNVKNLSVDCKLTNGSTESTPYLDSAANLIGNENKNSNTTDKDTKSIPLIITDSDNVEIFSISDNEANLSHTDDHMKHKSDTDSYVTSLTKATQIEKNIGIYVKLKCLLNIDETSKEFLSKELVAVNCESTGESSTRLKNDDTSASLADISGNDNKDGSPGSVNSNPQLFQLNPSRLSLVSTISSSSSASSAASLAAKLAKDLHFSLPRGPAKHTKKILNDPLADKQYVVDETYDRLSKEWKNHHLLVTNILSFVNAELSNVDVHNLSNERLEQPVQKIRCSTPEAQREESAEHLDTPKHGRKNRGTKRTKAQNVKSYSKPAKLSRDSSASESSTSDKKLVSSKSKVDMDDTGKSLKSSPINQTLNDKLIGKEVFAKWSDNNYYPGTVADKMKSKYKVAFYDGQHKQLIEDFIIPIPKTLKEGLSVYATSNVDEYGSCGIIVDVQTIKDKIHYIVETDEGEKLKVQIKDIFLSPDQAQLLKEESVDQKSLPSTPKHLAQVTLDNMMDGKRRSKRTFISTPSTPKSRRHTGSVDDAEAEPSVSGISRTTRKQSTTVSDNENKTTSDSNASLIDDVELLGVQSEIIGTPNEQMVKGPRSRMKGKQPRSKKKSDDNETVTTLGPIPQNSNLFKGMSFIITCASLESLDRYKNTDTKDSNSEFETENEDEWVQTPFVRERLKEQIEAGGGKIYEDFSVIPKDEYKNVKLITNVPNLTKKHLQCLSVGIPAYNHKWIIRCCQQNKIVNPAEEQLPTGWSLDKKSYIEPFQRSNKKPLSSVIVMIPTSESDEEFVSFWSQICGNAGAVVLLIEKSASMEDFMEGTVVLTNNRCPAWVIKKASELQIPLLSTTWITQCLIEGQICPYDTQERYKYNYVQT